MYFSYFHNAILYTNFVDSNSFRCVLAAISTRLMRSCYARDTLATRSSSSLYDQVDRVTFPVRPSPALARAHRERTTCTLVLSMLKMSVLVVRSCALYATLTRSCRLSVRSQLVVGAPSTLRPALSKFSERTGSVLGAQAWCDRGISQV